MANCTNLQNLNVHECLKLDVKTLDVQIYQSLKSLKIVSNKYIAMPKEWVDGLFQHPTLEDITLRNKAHTKWIMSQQLVKEAIRLKNEEETVSTLTPLQEKIQGYLNPKIVGDDHFYYCLYVYAGLYQHQGNEATFEEMVTLYEQTKRPEIKKLAAAEVLYLWSLTKLHELMTDRGSKHDVQEAYEPEPEPEPEDAIEAEDTQSERPEILERKRKDLSVLRKGVSLLKGTRPDALALSATTKQQILTVLQYLKMNLSDIESDPGKLKGVQNTYEIYIKALSRELEGSTSPSECQQAHERWLKEGIAEYIAENHPGIEITPDDIHFELDKEGFSLDIGVELKSTTGDVVKYCIELDGKHHEDNYFQVLSDEFRDEYLTENGWNVIRINNRAITDAVRKKKTFKECVVETQQDPKRQQKVNPKKGKNNNAHSQTPEDVQDVRSRQKTRSGHQKSKPKNRPTKKKR